jgi:hypothetical protein
MTTAQVVEPGHELCPIMSRDRSQVLLFITVPDGEKKLKNRLHFDPRPVRHARRGGREAARAGRVTGR